MTLKLLLKTPVTPYSGYGNDGIGLTRSLLRRGVDLYLQPLYCNPPLPRYVAELLTRRLDAPFDVILVHTSLDTQDFASLPEVRRATKFLVGWSMWEYTTFDNMHKEARETLKERLSHFDVLIGYDSVTCEALKEYAPDIPILSLQGGYMPEEWSFIDRDWFSDRFGFFMEGQLHERKDPFVAIEAFRQLKAECPDFEGAELHLKTNVPGLHPAMEEVIPKLRVHYATWPVELLREFYARQHCLLAPSRGEGKNVPALQFMSTGGLTIATGWAGHTVWQDPSYCYALDYELRPVSSDTPRCLNARASVDHLKELMLKAYRERGESKRMGSLAAQVIPQSCSWDAVLERLFLQLKELEGGSLVWDLWCSTPRPESAVDALARGLTGAQL